MTAPSDVIIKASQETIAVKDASGRELAVKRLNALDRLRLLKAAGPILSENRAWMDLALLAASVSMVQGVPVPLPCSEAQIEALVGRLGDVGLDAVSTALTDLLAEADGPAWAAAGNSPGTPI